MFNLQPSILTELKVKLCDDCLNTEFILTGLLILINNIYVIQATSPAKIDNIDSNHITLIYIASACNYKAINIAI